MPLLSFEGVAVEIPTTLQGITFAITDGVLRIQCVNFTGDIVMAKSPCNPTTTTATPLTTVNAVAPPAKRSSPDDLEDSDSTADTPLRHNHKRQRANFLSDVEHTMLLAQLAPSPASSSEGSEDTVIEPSQATTDVGPPTASSSSSSPQKPSAATTGTATPAQTQSPPDLKTPAKAKHAGHLKSFFSPDPKELATKKAGEAGKKGVPARPAKTKTSDGAQVSILDMMMMGAQPVKTPPVAEVPETVNQPQQRTLATWSMVETAGEVPRERWGHTVTPISDNRVVVYGGADDDEATLGDLHVFDIVSKTWSKPPNCESIPRNWHAAVYLAAKHLLLVFGGERVVGDDQLDVLSDIMVLDTECFLWYPPSVGGATPTPRSGHTCTVVGNDVVVFGGSRGRSRQSSVHVLDTDSWQWKAVKVDGKPPSARTYHSAVAIGDHSIVYFGGNDSKKSFDSVHVLKKLDDKTDAWAWFHPCVVGPTPSARTGHSATLLDESKILIFGGWDPHAATSEPPTAPTKVFHDAFVLNTVTWEWESVQLEASETADDDGMAMLAARVGHAAVAGVDANTVLVFGGQNAHEQRLSEVHALTLRAKSS